MVKGFSCYNTKMIKTIEKAISTAKQMKLFGAEIAKSLPQDIRILLLEGSLGAGKTTFAQGFAKRLGVKNQLTSPTFTLMNSFPLPKQKKILHHIDLYRIDRAEDLVPLGIHELLHDPQSIVLIEWSNKHSKLFDRLPRAVLHFTIQKLKRTVRVRFFSKH